MRQALKPHPDTPCEAVDSIEVEAVRTSARGLELRYLVSGDIGRLAVPAMSGPRRADELWRHTCFEAFVLEAYGPGYAEINLSPSMAWAAYRFDGYRSGATRAEVAGARIEIQGEAGRLELKAWLDLSSLDRLPQDGPWRIGLSAVIEQADGAISYWALSHPAGRPDFHHPDCFAAELMAPEAP